MKDQFPQLHFHHKIFSLMPQTFNSLRFVCGHTQDLIKHLHEKCSLKRRESVRNTSNASVSVLSVVLAGSSRLQSAVSS